MVCERNLHNSWRGVVVGALVVLLLTACTSQRPPLSPVANQTQLAGAIPDSYTVRTGDSLYMIAMEFNLDYRDLSAWNGISAPYLIYRGQELQLHPSAQNRQARVVPSGDYYIVRSGDTLSGIAVRFGVKLRQLAQWNQLSKPYQIHVGQKLRIRGGGTRQASTKEPKKSHVAQQRSQRRSSGGSNTTKTSSLKWPSSGKVAKKYSKSRGMTGVEFHGRQGDPVRAAGDGKVVYSGSGLVRYGKLLIVKHDNNLLTAYAHNSQLQVAEGDLVKAGQQIAKMGSSGTDRVKLHFEVRKSGQPIDPMRFLSKR